MRLTGRTTLQHAVRSSACALLACGLLAVEAQALDTPRWRESPSVHVSGDSNAITALVASGANDVWAFGYDLTSIPEWRVLGEHWNGSSWMRLNMPDRETAPAADMLEGAALTRPGDVWAVGESATAIGMRSAET